MSKLKVSCSLSYAQQRMQRTVSQDDCQSVRVLSDGDNARKDKDLPSRKHESERKGSLKVSSFTHLESVVHSSLSQGQHATRLTHSSSHYPPRHTSSNHHSTQSPTH